MKTNNYYKFDCGCKIPIVNDTIKECDGLPSLELDYYHLPECPNVWNLFDTGRTKGIFQLEKQLGQSWSKQTSPHNIEELSTLIAILRPGSLESIVDGKSMTARYADRKNNREEVKYFFDVLEPILKETYGVLVFQEQSIKIATELAGFNLQEADQLRKATGKKDAKLMNETETLFLAKAKEFGKIDEATAKEIFGWIKESNRYAFNKCLHPHTQVITPDCSLDIEHIKPGDKVLGVNLNGTNDFFEVKEVMRNGKKRMFEFCFTTIKSSNGFYIRCTLDHKLLCEDGECHPLYEILINNYKVQTKYGLAELVKLDFVGNVESVDIEIDSLRHVFYANGILTSNSHSVSYAELGYWSAFVKYHFPMHFYTAWLQHRKDDKYENETKLLIDDAKNFSIETALPSVLNVKYGDPGQTLLHNQQLYLGISDIKGLGDSKIDECLRGIAELETTYGDIKSWSWMTFLTKLFEKVSSITANGLISAGALSHLGKSRTSMIFEYNLFNSLTNGPKNLVIDKNFGNLGDLFKFLIDHPKTRNKHKIEDLLKTYESPSYQLTDGINVIVKMEEEFLETAISCTRLDSCINTIGDTTCLEFANGKNTKKMTIAVEISSIKEHITKSGKSAGQAMAFLSVHDNTGSINNVVAFSNIYSKYQNLLYKGNTVTLEGEKSDKGSFVIFKVVQI